MYNSDNHSILDDDHDGDDDNVEPQHPVLGGAVTDRPSDDGSDGSGFDSLVEEGESSDSEQEGNESSHCDDFER